MAISYNENEISYGYDKNTNTAEAVFTITNHIEPA